MVSMIPIKKLKNGFEMPVFGLGTWGMGGKSEHDPNNDDQRDIQAIKQAIDAGITHIDIAESYARGYSEMLVGKAIQEYDRSGLFIASKVHEEHLGYDDLLIAAEESLKRLQTDYLDLYYIHHPNDEVSIEETMSAMTKLKDTGMIKNIAVSNFTIERFEKAQAATSHKIVANQLHLNLIFREPERKGLVEYCQTQDVMLVAWRPVQKGMLSGANNPLFETICKKYNKTPSQIAINWLISQKNIVTISKMGSKR